MLEKILSLFLFSGFATAACAQMSKEERSQLKKTEAFMISLEKGMTEELLNSIDSSLLSKYPGYRDSLKNYSVELKKYLGKSELSIVIVYEHPGFNTFRCRYWKKSRTYFYIDLSYKNDDPKSMVMMIEKIPGPVLKQMDKDLINWSREQGKNGIPTPPKNSPPKTSE